jgi:formylglycine-generating enzyme required for sulfatase activity
MMKTIGMAMIVFGMFLAVVVCNSKESAAQAQQAGAGGGAEGKELTLDLGDKVTLKLVRIPEGKFLMGSPESEKDRDKNETQHEVTISKPFYMGVTEVTQEQYETVMGNNPSTFKGKTNPVEAVSWDDAQTFCKLLSKKSGKTVVLPTEAQWEYACRAGTKTRFSFGDKDEDLRKYGSYYDKADTRGRPGQDKEHSDGFGKTASLKPNAWGLYDMHGNVWEWCQDWHGDYRKGAATDPTGADTGSVRVLRGGSWRNVDPASCRSASRGGFGPNSRADIFGFRVAVVATGVD